VRGSAQARRGYFFCLIEIEKKAEESLSCPLIFSFFFLFLFVGFIFLGSKQLSKASPYARQS
jgi:hypothetical protein